MVVKVVVGSNVAIILVIVVGAGQKRSIFEGIACMCVRLDRMCCGLRCGLRCQSSISHPAAAVDGGALPMTCSGAAPWTVPLQLKKKIWMTSDALECTFTAACCCFCCLFVFIFYYFLCVLVSRVHQGETIYITITCIPPPPPPPPLRAN